MSGEAAGPERQWTALSVYTLALLTLVNALNFVDRSILSLVLPQIKRDMALSDTTLGLVSGLAFVLFYSTLGVPIARLADRSNRRNIIAVGLAFWSLMTVLTGAVVNVWQLALTRFLMGAGEASGMAPANSLTADLFGKAQRPLAVSILGAGTALGYVIFFPAAGWISEHYGWRATFVAAGAPGLLLALLLVFTTREPQRRAAETGAADAGQQPGFSAAIRLLAASRAYVLVVLAEAFLGVALQATGVWSPAFLMRVHHFTTTEAAAALGPLRGGMGVAGMLLGGVLAARLGRVDGRWRLWVPALACILVWPACLVFVFAGPAWLSIAGMAFAQFFMLMQAGPVYAVCMDMVAPRMRATSLAVMLLVANLVGQVIGPGAAGYLNDALSGRFGDLSVRYSLAIVTVTALMAGVLFLYASRSLAAEDGK